MNQLLFKLWESMELLSNRVLDPIQIDGEINEFAWGLEVNNGVRERELLLCFGRVEVRKKSAGCRWGGRGKVYIPPAPNGHLNHR